MRGPIPGWQEGIIGGGERESGRAVSAATFDAISSKSSPAVPGPLAKVA